VRDLAPLERWVLGVTLALLDEPEILLVDDIDGLRGSDDRAAAWAVLASLAGSPVRRTARTHRTQPARALTVVVSCRDLHEATDALAGAGGIPLVSLALASRSTEADSFVTEHTGDPWTDPVAASFTDPADELSEKVH
jgi:hypothetical protein